MGQHPMSVSLRGFSVFVCVSGSHCRTILTCQRHVFALAIHSSALSIGEAVVYDDAVRPEYSAVVRNYDWCRWGNVLCCIMPIKYFSSA